MSEQEDSVLSRLSISTGVIPFPSLDSSLLRQTLSALEGSSSPSPELMILRPSASSSALPELYGRSPSQQVTSDDVSALPSPINPPIPSNESPNPNPRPEPVTRDSASYSVAEESHMTASSSRLTSSDKLSALPSTTISSSPNAIRNTRSPSFSALANSMRGYRRSLDASTSLPSFSLAEPDLPAPIPNVWGTTPSLSARTETNNNNVFQRLPTPELGKDTPIQRVSFDSDRGSLPTMRSVGQAFTRRTKGNDSQTTPPVLRSSPHVEHRNVDSSSNAQELGSPSQSLIRSRAASPLRMFQQWSSGLRGHRATVEELFVPVDPFKPHPHSWFCCFPGHSHDLEIGEGSAFSGPYDCEDLIPTKSIKSFFNNTHIFIVDTLPRQFYLNFLLHLPAMYFSRVARIFEDAEVSKPDIQRMIDDLGRGGTATSGGPGMVSMQAGNNGQTTGNWEPNILAQSTPAHIPMSTFSPLAPGISSPGAASGSPSPQIGATAPVASMMHMPLPFPDEWAPPLVSPALIRFKHSWEGFIDSLLREWKTLNVVSAVLASTILTVFQIPQAANDPVTRTAALLSLVCALMSLAYGCMYSVRFGMMKNMFHASRWAEEAQKTNTSIWWNVWVLLAMPAIWMSWAMLLFISAILSFVWRTGSVSDPTNRPPLGDRAALGPRIAITSVLFLGLVYLAMIVRTLKKYGSNENSTKALLQVGSPRIRNNTPQGGGTQQIHGNTTTEGHGSGTGEKKMRARDIDAAMERRGRQRERSVSNTQVRRREEHVERRQHGGQSSVGDGSAKRGGQNSKAMLGLGLGSRVIARDSGELEELSEVEMDLKIEQFDSLP
ncbi:hypothetical protein BYT27DRAFT_7159054 [Phlegmacium glaucopus]|nr:hypothetical protein BYT27DRAFT_7159054 [Phlegmacium glaucopus]